MIPVGSKGLKFSNLVSGIFLSHIRQELYEIKLGVFQDKKVTRHMGLKKSSKENGC